MNSKYNDNFFCSQQHFITINIIQRLLGTEYISILCVYDVGIYTKIILSLYVYVCVHTAIKYT